MKRFILLLLLLSFVCIPAYAMEAPPPPPDALMLMPESMVSFGMGVQSIAQNVLQSLNPDLSDAIRSCASIIAAVMAVSIVTVHSDAGKLALKLAAIGAVSTIFFSQAGSLIRLAENTIQEMSDYGKLLLPVITAALAAQGRPGTSAALYAGTAVFNTAMGSILSGTILPMLSFFLAMSICAAVTSEKLLKNLKKEMKTFVSWSLKTILSVFTAYISITGVVSGATDAAALKATKTAISAMVPVVGGVLSEASEAVLVSAQIVKNSVGIYGIYALLAIFLKPFAQIGMYYLLLRVTVVVCSLFASDEISALLEDFSSVLALLLAVTGAMCLLLLISCICFIKGAAV